MCDVVYTQYSIAVIGKTAREAAQQNTVVHRTVLADP